MHLQLKCCQLSNAEPDMVSLKGNPLNTLPSWKLKSCGTESLEKSTKRREAWAFSLLRREKYARHSTDESAPFSSEQPCSTALTCPGYKAGFSTLKLSKPSPRQTYLNCSCIFNKYTRDVQPGKVDNHLHIIGFDILILFSYKSSDFEVNNQNLFVPKTTFN